MYRGAKISTPVPSVSASPTPQRVQQSATRSSARIAARNSVLTENSVEMSPSKGRGFTGGRPLVSDSIDEDDDEDPLHTPKRHDLRSTSRNPSTQPPTSEASRQWTRPESVQRYSESPAPESPSPSPRPRPYSRDTASSGSRPNVQERVRLAGSPREDNESSVEDDESEGEPTPTARKVLREVGGNIRPNPIRDARFGNLVLPRPDRAGSQPPLGRPINQSAASSARSDNRDKPPVVNSPQRQRSPSSSTVPPTRPPVERPLYPQLSSEPRPPTQYRPSLAEASRPISKTVSNHPGLRHRRDHAGDGPAKQRPQRAVESAQAAPTEPQEPAPEEPQEPAPEESQANFLQGFARGTKWEDILNAIFDWSWMILKIWAILAAAAILYLIFIDCIIPVRSWNGIDVYRDYDYEGISYWRQKILQIIPWVVLHPFSVLTGNLDYADYRKVLRDLDLGIRAHESRISAVSDATWQMRRVLPELIKVNVKSSTGEWTIGDEFWNALDAKMHEGGLMYSILTMDHSNDGTYSISDPHWSAIKTRIEQDPMLVSDRPASGQDRLLLSDQVIEYVDQHTSKVWTDWLKANQDSIGKLQGKPGDTPSRTYQELYGDLEDMMNKRFQALGIEQGVVTRDEFITKFKESVASHKSEIASELQNLHSKLDQALGIALEAKATAEYAGGVPREEVEEMIDQAMRLAISDAVLEAIAKGHLKAHLEQEVIRKKNYFNIIRGAIVDPKMTSTTYTWAPNDDIKSSTKAGRGWSFFKKSQQQAFREGGETMHQPSSPQSALERWDEDGECWCAGLADHNNVTGSNSNAVADLGIYTADSVIPQYLVVEHIDSGASFDPKSMPRDIEFWILTPQDRRARTLSHWSTDRWPAIKYNAASRKLLDKGYVKIGQFMYDNTIGKGESQLLQFSKELIDMDAQTQQVLVRATSNYGAEDHTCFYRLKLFGEAPSSSSNGDAGATLNGQ